MKPKRSYNSTRRQAQALQTRRQIVESARSLFTERGYAGTTLEVIAQRTGVAVETVYAIFKNKRAILAELIDISLVGDQEPIPLFEGLATNSAQNEFSQQQQIRLFAHNMRQIMERMGPIFEIMNTAAKTEPDISTLLQQILQERLEGISQFIQYLAASGPLREGVIPSEVAETVWVLTSAEIHRLLTVTREWSGDRYEKWLGDTLIVLFVA